MPIVRQNDPVSEARSQAIRAGAGVSVEREQALEINAAANRRAEEQLNLQAQNQAFNQQFSLRQQNFNEQLQSLNVDQSLRQEQRVLQQQEFTNLVTERSQDRSDRALTETIEDHKLAKLDADRKFKLDQETAAFSKEKFDIALKLSEEERLRGFQLKKNNAAANTQMLQAVTTSLPPKLVPGLLLAAQSGSDPSDFGKVLNETISASGLMDHREIKAAVAKQTKVLMDENVKDLKFQLASRVEYLQLAAGKNKIVDVAKDEAVRGYLTEINRIQKLSYLVNISPEAAVPLPMIEEITGDTSRSTGILEHATEKLIERLMPDLMNRASQRALMQGREPNALDGQQVVQEYMDSDDFQVDRRAEFNVWLKAFGH